MAGRQRAEAQGVSGGRVSVGDGSMPFAEPAVWRRPVLQEPLGGILAGGPASPGG